MITCWLVWRGVFDTDGEPWQIEWADLLPVVLGCLEGFYEVKFLVYFLTWNPFVTTL